MPKDDGALEFLGIFVTLTALATILVALRLWIRATIVRELGVDDWVVLTSLVHRTPPSPPEPQADINQILMYGSMGCMASAFHHVPGKHISTLCNDEAVKAIRMLCIGSN
ncbi:MAG: hypothetical protein MMC23_009226 [Stictis urceolatum]|nr:hypothetical protein [Stictis urceolata]